MYVQYVYPGRFSALVSLFRCDCVIPNIFVYVCVGVGLLGIGKAPMFVYGSVHRGVHVCISLCTHTPLSMCVFFICCICVCACRFKSVRASLCLCAVIFKCVFGCVSGIWHACEGLSPSKPVVEYVSVRCRVLVSRLVRLLSRCVAAALPGCHLIGRCDFLMHTGA